MSEIKSYNGVLGLDNLPNEVKTMIWIATLMLTVVASVGLTMLSFSKFGGYSIAINGAIIYIFAPALGINCCAGAGLRLVGVPWKYVGGFWAVVCALSMPIIWVMGGLLRYILQG
jgi:hypothetical protein